MNFSHLESFLGWCVVLNSSVLIVTTLLLIVLKKQILLVHSKILGIEKKQLSKAYFCYLAIYKIFTLIFFIIPYCALKIMQLS